MSNTYFIPADAHEGCVWVAAQDRLYFSTSRKEEGPGVAIHYLDFSHFELARDGNWAERLDQTALKNLEAQSWVADANMANSLSLSRDGKALLVAEQGDMENPSRVSRIELDDKSTTIRFDGFDGKPLNSLNKVIESRQGHLIVSDPDYGFRQGFRPAPELEPSLYVIPQAGEPFAFDCGLEMPHGLALSPDEKTLFVTDTSNDGAHGEQVNLGRRASVHRFSFDPATGRISGDGTFLFSVDQGVPDGSETDGEALLVCGGDGIYVADGAGHLRGKIPLPRTAVNLAVVGDHLFVTADAGVYLILDWRTRVS